MVYSKEHNNEEPGGRTIVVALEDLIQLILAPGIGIKFAIIIIIVVIIIIRIRIILVPPRISGPAHLGTWHCKQFEVGLSTCVMSG